MSEVAHRLAELSGRRRRQELDESLVKTIGSVLRPTAARLFRFVGRPDDLRWSLRAQHVQGLPDGAFLPHDDEPEDLPRVAGTDIGAQVLAGIGVHTLRDSAPLSVLPLSSGSEVLGAVEVTTTRPLLRAELALLDDVLAVYSNVQGLLDYSEKDSLTGLLNRKTFDSNFYQVSSPAVSGSTPVYDRRGQPQAQTHWIAVIDVDHFKSVNDRFGHLIGDEVLILLARLMRGTFRHSDQLYRFGGEEFVVLFRNLAAEHVPKALERLREATERFDFPQVGRLTISGGFARIEPGDAPSDVVDRADQAVYHAKSHGRNQICGYEQLVEQGMLKHQKKVGEIELF